YNCNIRNIIPIAQTIIRWETNRQILKETGFTRENDPAFEAILDAMEGGSAFEVITQYIKETPSGQKIQMKRIF
ncbi:MAG: hypothetical protein ACLU4W_07515, partial [Acutalibacteraceae bacterium]